MLRIIVEVDAEEDAAIGVKELLAAALERVGIARIVQIKEVGQPQQVKLWGGEQDE